MSVVTEEMLHIAITEYWNAERKKEHGMRAALAAVAPLIAAQEREAAWSAILLMLDSGENCDQWTITRAATLLNAMLAVDPERTRKWFTTDKHPAAIRALGDAT